MRRMGFNRWKMDLLRMLKLFSYAFAISCITKGAEAYTVVTISTSAPAGTETSFIATTTNTYQATVSTNPFFANTFSMVIYGPNPSYNPPPTNADLLNNIVTVDSFTYVYGWADGASYQQYRDANAAGDFIVNCDSPTYWSAPIDTTTCYAVLGIMENFIYEESLSTPTTVPGNFQ